MDKVKRGFEAHARDLFELLRYDDRLDLTLIKGSGVRRPREKVIFNFHRQSAANGLLCRVVGESRRWYIEFVSFAVGLLPLLFLKRFDAFYVSEGALYRFLRWWRHVSRQDYALIHATGGWFDQDAPVRVLRSATGRIIPPTRADYLHHVNPCYLAAAETCGFPRENQFLIPHLFSTRTPLSTGAANSGELRDTLGIPPDMPVVLSVGSIDRSHKRMDYVIEEAATVSPAVFVLLAGDQNAESSAVRDLAMRKLGSGRFAIVNVPREDIFRYYELADVFVLASLREAFGIVFIEALMAGLPVIAHDYDVSRYVLGEHGYFADLSVPAGLANTLRTVLGTRQTDAMKRARVEYVTHNYDAQALKAQYQHMFLSACVGASQERTSERATMPTQRL
jgi:glycosyltransferase involved in cell wall biosynthesis